VEIPNLPELSRLQLGKYAEYFVKMTMVGYGYDVYVPEVDDKGIDFVVRVEEDNYYEFQVKSVRLERGKSPYIYFRKNNFKLRKSLFIILVVFKNCKPNLYVIPSLIWKKQNKVLNYLQIPISNFPKIFVDRERNDNSKSEWGISLSFSKMSFLESFKLTKENLERILTLKDVL
jgi:hypothetical protein